MELPHSFDDIKKMFRHAGTLADHEFVSPTRDWSIALLGHVILLFALIAFGVFTYIRVEKTMQTTQEGAPVETLTIDRGDLTRALEYFSARTETFIEQEEFLLEVVDPAQ